MDDDDATGNKRRRPNILITGTPGVGKTATASSLAERLSLKHINVGSLIQENKFHDGRDEELETFILDEDKLLDHMENLLEEAVEEGVGVVADFHSCELFPERWFDLVLVLRTKTEILFDRLTKRGYSGKKLDSNMQSEIMQVILEEARESYATEIVHEVPSNNLQDMESNISRVEQWLQIWLKDNGQDTSR